MTVSDHPRKRWISLYVENDVGVLATCEYEALLSSGVIQPRDFRLIAEKPPEGGCRRSAARYPDVVFSSLPWVDAETGRYCVEIVSIEKGKDNIGVSDITGDKHQRSTIPLTSS